MKTTTNFKQELISAKGKLFYSNEHLSHLWNKYFKISILFYLLFSNIHSVVYSQGSTCGLGQSLQLDTCIGPFNNISFNSDECVSGGIGAWFNFTPAVTGSYLISAMGDRDFSIVIKPHCGAVPICINNFTMDFELATRVLGAGTTYFIAVEADSIFNLTSICIYLCENPLISDCPTDINVTTDPGECSAIVDYTVDASGNPDPNFMYIKTLVPTQESGNGTGSGTAFGLGSTFVEVTATNACLPNDLCAFTVTVEDQEMPIVNCPSNQIKMTNPGQCVYSTMGNEFDPVNLSDNCTVDDLENNINGLSTLNTFDFDKGNHMINWVVYDAAGNSAECSMNLEIIDTELPELRCPRDTIVYSETFVCPYTVVGVEFDPLIKFDNCEIYLLYNNINYGSTLQDHYFPKGTHSISWFVADITGNQNSCSFEITVMDTVKPWLDCPVDTMVFIGVGNCEFDVVDGILDIQRIIENCGILTVVNNINGDSTLNGYQFEDGVHYIEWTVTDICNNTSTCSFEVTIPKAENLLACKNLNISLGADCLVEITPRMLLTNGICAEDVIVELSHYNHPIPNPVDSHYLGKRLVGKVLDTLTGNSCWSDILIEDKLAPEVLCRNIRVSCLDFETDSLYPTVTFDCSHYTVRLVDEEIESLFCHPELIKRVMRTWISVDSYGNESAPCVQEIEVERFDIFQVAFPPESVILECDRIDSFDVNAHPHPYISGIPHFYSYAIWPTIDFLCNVYVDYEDTDLGKIGCTRKIMRVWRVREWWCSQELENFAVQIIQIQDNLGPRILHSHYDFEATTSHKSCEADVVIPPIEAIDACHNDLRIDVVYPGGVLVDQNGGRVRLPVGLDTIIYRVYDECYNLTEDTLYVTVRDHTEPVAVCERRTVVSINDSGSNWVPAEVFDDGSFDECKIHHFEVRRMDLNHCGTIGEDDWGPEVQFCCSDVGAGEVMVAFKVIDVSGNEAICMVLVEVQDKDMPRITCPPNIDVDCRFDFDINHLDRSFGKVVTEEADREMIVIDPVYWHEIFGHPQDGIAYDNCDPNVTVVIDSNGMNQCGMGTIIRVFTVTDAQGNSASCSQRIQIDNHLDGGRISIQWPFDYETSDICDSRLLHPDLLSPPYNYPVVSDDECSIIGMDFKDHVFSSTVPGEPCFKILRVWKVIDWCYRNDLGDIVIYQDTQIIKVSNFVDPIIYRSCRDTTICTYDVECRPIPVRLSIGASDVCTAKDELLYRYKIDLNSDGTIDIIRTSIGDSVAFGTWPLGRHIIKWEVEDRCGNTAKCESELNLINCKPPTAYCHRDLSIGLTAMDLNGDGIPETKMAEVWASDINVNSEHGCGYDIVFSFSADTSDKVRFYNCDSIGPRNVELWVTDINGNQSFCRTVIIIEDNPQQPPACPGNLKDVVVSGLVKTAGDREVEEAQIALLTSPQNAVKTNYEGRYAFSPMPTGGNYEIKPEKNDDWTNGVTTGDIVRIQKHILAIEDLNSPYLMIAADVNKSKSVTARDISDLRKLILGVSTEVKGNTSWRFVPLNYSFANPEEALENLHPEEYKINYLGSDLKADFVAIKVGDVNESAKTRGANGVSNRTAQTLDLYYEDVEMKKGEMYEIQIKSSNISKFTGFQTTVELGGEFGQMIELVPNRQNHFGEEHYSLHSLHNGKISMSWDGHAKNDERLLSIKIKSNLDGRLSDMLRLSSSITQTMSIDEHQAEGRIELRSTGMLDKEFVLLQNEPNPWKEQSSIGLLLPRAGTVRLTIYDATGRVHLKAEKEMAKGYQEWIIEGGIVTGTGVYYYQADYESNTQTRKMVILE
ncbi:MAG: HYR domain-containing protein [Saprospiraceae bacterium]|nr:HYR domain-containing protein [Saprospiraceae bacterium]MBK7809741.1 HYR domain-containing protein [Saprospiraceae bacterium]